MTCKFEANQGLPCYAHAAQKERDEKYNENDLSTSRSPVITGVLRTCLLLSRCLFAQLYVATCTSIGSCYKLTFPTALIRLGQQLLKKKKLSQI